MNHAGLSGNIVNAGGALGQGAGAGLTMMGGAWAWWPRRARWSPQP
ncbi:hypothetical protein [Deinococcus radiophilus]